MVKTLRGGGDTQTLPSLIEFELFAFTGGGDTKTLLSHTLMPKWILRARDRDRDILARLRFGHQRPLNRRCPGPAWTPATSKSWVSAGVQAGVPGYSVNLLLFTYWYFSSGHLRFSGRWCPNLNLAKISLSLSRLKTTHMPKSHLVKLSQQ